MKTWPTVYCCRLMEPGIISYQDSGDGIAYVPKETIDRIAPSLIGKPVVIKHQDVTPQNAAEKAVGWVTGVFYNQSDAWHYAEFMITSDKVEPIEKEDGGIVFKTDKGDQMDGVSGAYDVLNASGEGVWHDIKFDHKIIDGSFTHLALVNNPRYEETNRIVERMPSMLVNGKVATMKNNVEGELKEFERNIGSLKSVPDDVKEKMRAEIRKGKTAEQAWDMLKDTFKPNSKENAVDNYFFTVNGERFRIYIKEGSDGRFYCEAQDKSGAVVHTTLPQRNQAEARYACEAMLYLQTRNSKDNAKKLVIIDIPFRLISKVGDKEGISDGEVESRLRAKGIKSVGAGGGEGTFEFEGSEQQAAQAVKEVLGTLSSVTIGAVENASGQAAFDKEKKEHPDFTDDQIWKIVRDHEEKQNAALDDNQRAVLKWMDDTNAGAVPHEGKWIFKEAIRQDPNLARALKEYINKENSIKQNSKEGQMNLFKIFKKLVNGEEEVTDLSVDIDGKMVAVNDLIEAYKSDEAEEAKKKAENEKRLQAEKEAEEKRKKDEEEAKENARKNLKMAKDEDTVEIDGKKVTIGELKNRYAKKNASETPEEKADREKKEKEAKDKENSEAEKQKAKKDADVLANGRAGVFKKGETVRDINGVFCKIVGEAQSGDYYVVQYPDGSTDRMREADINSNSKESAQEYSIEKENAKKTAEAKHIEFCNSKKSAGEIFMATNSKLAPGDPVQLGAAHYIVTELGENPIGTAGVWLKENAKKGEEFFSRIANAGNEPPKPAQDAPVGRQERAARSTAKHSSKRE